MAQDVVINGATYPGVEAVSMTDTNGNTRVYFPDAVRYNTQTLTEAQKAQARLNLGVGSIDEVAEEVLARLGTPVFGRVDAENNITLTGELADGTYTIKYEDAEGNVTEIGTLNTDPGPAYKNWIEYATELDGVTWYNRCGYKKGLRYSASGGNETNSGAEKITISGFIPVNPGDVIRIKNITLKKTSSVGNAHHIIIFPSLSLSGGSAKDIATAADWQQVWDADSQLVQCTVPASLSVKYIRIQAEYIGDDSILTINELIE
jgi:hypothetical protein